MTSTTPQAGTTVMDLGQLLQVIGPHGVSGDLDHEIRAVVSDSRAVRPGDLFVAIRGGQERDRHAFVADAVERGAVAVVVEDGSVDAGSATRIVVDDSRRALARLAARWHGNPAAELQCIGITGTNGKSTTATLMRHILDAAGRRCAYLGTVGFHYGQQRETVANTTPEADQLQALLGRARDAGCDAVAMEVSSHGLALQRVHGIEFAAAVFTNLTRDHLDFHGSEGAYFAAKDSLFRGLDGTAVAVLNADDPASARIGATTPARVFRYGETGADVRLRRAAFEARRTHIEIDTPEGVVELETALTGRFNCSNVVAAVACGFALGIPATAIRIGVAALQRMPGRFERVDEGQPFEAIVDYAHTPAGLETVLQAARELTRGRLLCVFGCGGDRDTGKRPMMGRVAAALADLVFLTSDNPRSEPPEQIIAQVAAGMDRSDGVHVCVDRREAIRAALESAVEGDVVVLAGKGDEPYQLLGDRRIDFDDRVEARAALRRRGTRVA